jgi:hypothetical protein
MRSIFFQEGTFVFKKLRYLLFCYFIVNIWRPLARILIVFIILQKIRFTIFLKGQGRFLHLSVQFVTLRTGTFLERLGIRRVLFHCQQCSGSGLKIPIQLAQGIRIRNPHHLNPRRLGFSPEKDHR